MLSKTGCRIIAIAAVYKHWGFSKHNIIFNNNVLIELADNNGLDYTALFH